MVLFELPPPTAAAAAPKTRAPTSAQVGAVIARRRVDRGWRQYDLASRARVPLSTLQRVENGTLRRGVPLERLEQIAAALGLSALRILAEAGDEP